MKYNNFIKIMGCIFLGLFLLTGYDFIVYSQEQVTPYIGVVDLDKLLKSHGSWKELKKLDKKLALLQYQGGVELSSSNKEEVEKQFSSLMAEFENRAKKKQEELSEIWMSQQDSVASQLQALQDRYSAMQAAEMDKILSQNKAELEAMENEFHGELIAKSEEQVAIIQEKYRPEIEKEKQAIESMLDQYAGAFVAEIEKKIQEKNTVLNLELDEVFTAERNRMLGDLEKYKQKRLEENQNDLMQINLAINKIKSQSTFTKEDEEKIKELSGERDALDVAYQADIDTATREMEGNFNSFKEKKLAEAMVKVDAYKAELNKELEKKLEPKKQEFDGILSKKISEIEDKVQSEILLYQEPFIEEFEALFNKRQEELNAAAEQRMISINEQVAGEYEKEKNAMISHLDKKQAEMAKEMDTFGQQLQKEFDKKRSALENELYGMQEDEAVESENQYTELQKERKDLYKSMLKDISVFVKKTGKKKGISVVITGYWMNVSSVDLTEDVLALMNKDKKESSKDKEE